MKSNKILSLIISLFIGTYFFAAVAYAANSPDTESAQKQKDGEIIAILIAVDKSEIILAKEALTKKTTPAIKQYAQMLEAQHSQNFSEALRLSKATGIAPIETTTVVSLQIDGAKGLVTLSALHGKAFEKAYINAMVTGHTNVLKMMDDNLLKNVSNPYVKTFLLATRAHIDAHFLQGQALQKEFN